MITDILSALAGLIVSVIESVGYLGVFFLMALDSFNIPVPSEVIMPFSGFLASRGIFSFWLIVCVGTLGSYAGSVCSYYLAEWLVKNRNRFFLHLILSDLFIERANTWFTKYGTASVFFGRLIPVVRTFISLPAGIGRVQFKKFTVMTLAGSFIWTLGLAYLGRILGENWDSVRDYFHIFDGVIAFALVCLVLWWIYMHLTRRRARKGVGDKKDLA